MLLLSFSKWLCAIVLLLLGVGERQAALHAALLALTLALNLALTLALILALLYSVCDPRQLPDLGGWCPGMWVRAA